MKKNLNYYYRKKYRDLTAIMCVGVLCLSLGITIDIINYFYLVKLDSFDYFKGDSDKHSTFEKVMLLSMRIIQEFTHMFYIFYFVRQIDFKQYVLDIMSGYRIDDQFHSDSKFIMRGIMRKQRKMTTESLYHEEGTEDADTFAFRHSTIANTWGIASNINLIDNTYKENYERNNEIKSINKSILDIPTENTTDISNERYGYKNHLM
jgi:hypothetical protein